MSIFSQRNRTPARRPQRGFTLVELLVAMTVFAVAVGVAFVLYNAAQNSYKEGEQFVEQQQNTRIAFDRIVTDLRMAGFNYNPDGDSTRPDEQIEGAWDTAITIRGDFDFEITPADNPTDNNVTPEAALTGSYNVVSTGNSEIVTYALGKPDGSGGVNLVFNADVQEAARNGTVEPVQIPNIHLDQSAPPYTLYRINLSNTNTDYGNWSAFSNKQPVADNIKSLQFRYFDGNGTQLNTFDLTQTADDIGGAEAVADVATRASIRRIEVDLVGLTPDPDLDYVDTTDAIAATRNYRKFELTTDVVSQNLGLEGMPDLVLTAPRMPQNVSLCGGHCEGLVVKWQNQYASEDSVTGYTVWYGTNPANLGTPIGTSDMYAWVGNLPGGPYYFGVQANNGSDKSSVMTTTVSGTPANDTRPLPIDPGNLYASGGSNVSYPASDSRIDLGWGSVIENTSEGASDATTGCDPVRPVNRDLIGYRLHRGASSGFTLGTPLADESVLPGTTNFADTTVVNCRNYYYVVEAVDGCGGVSDPSTEVGGSATTTTPPAAPMNLVSMQSGANSIDLSWDPVTQNTGSPPASIGVGAYNVYSTETTSGTNPDAISDSSYFLVGTATGGTAYQHFFSFISPGNSMFFKVSALDDCPNESVLSSGSESTCDFFGTLGYNLSDADNVAGTVPMSLMVTGSQTYTRGLIRVQDLTTMGDVYYEETWTAPFIFPDWDSSAVSPGSYRVYYEVENSNGCSYQEEIDVVVNTAIACCVGAANPTLLPTKGNASNQNKKLAFDIANNCGTDIEIIGITTDWTEIVAGVGDTALFAEVGFPTGTPVLINPLPLLRPAFSDFGSVPLFLSALNNSFNAVNMQLIWDNPMADKISGTVFSETIYLRYDYITLLSGQQGFCNMEVQPDAGTVVALP